MYQAPAVRHVVALSTSLIAFMAGMGVAYAQTNTADGPQSTRTPDQKWGVSLSVENDLFTPSNSDQHYTNGVRLAFVSPEDSAPAAFLNVAKQIPFFASDGRIRTSYSLGQTMYTPDDITIAENQPNDRPWAGMLYGTAGLLSDTGLRSDDGESNYSRIDTLELTLGVVGPASLADKTQDFVHKVIDSPRPKGWDNQIKNEPIIGLTYERKYRSWFEADIAGIEFDATPHGAVTLGNAFTNAELGTMFRMGFDLPADYGPPRIRPSLPGSDFFVPDTEGFPISGYLFAGFAGRYVLRDITLDGNTFADSAWVDKEPLVGDLQIGFAVIVGQARLTYTHVYRTPEFTAQSGADQFGSLSLSFRF
ncbi:lipid A deacylase LpxR family protein [Thalassospira sp. CH_XMU1448-2]|uniref:lipid A deacylase LpxR family protein n=1 Tax=Thalassospira sp. CH_XMU1448-2 TaxID=3107773 RepID=UPI003009DD2C